MEMSETEYNERMKKIESDYAIAQRQLYMDYAMSHAKYKVGDTIRDERWAFVIDKITVSKYFGLPEPVYHGYELKKDLTPRKDGSRVCIHGNRTIELIKST